MGCCCSSAVIPSPGGRDFEGIPANKAELKIIARLMSDTYQRGAADRWPQIDVAARKELTIIANATQKQKRGEDPPTWEDRQPLKPKYLMKQACEVYALRRDHVQIPKEELQKLMHSLSRLLTVKESDGDEKAVVSDAAAAETAAAETAVNNDDEDKKEPEKKRRKKRKNAIQDFSPDAMKQLSMAERAAKDMRAEGYEYGEVDPESLFELLYRLKMILGHFWPPRRPISDLDALTGGGKQKKKRKKGKGGGEEIEPPLEVRVVDCFLDLGSGAGKAVFCAALFFEFAACRGIDNIHGLVQASEELKERWDDSIAPSLQGRKAETVIEFKQGDLVSSTEMGLDKGDPKSSFLFINGPTFTDGMMAKLAAKANGRSVPSETIAIVTGRKWHDLDKGLWAIVAQDTLKMSWGVETPVFVYEKLPEEKRKKKK